MYCCIVVVSRFRGGDCNGLQVIHEAEVGSVLVEQILETSCSGRVGGGKILEL